MAAGSTWGGARAEATRLHERLDRLAEALYELDSDADVAFLKAQPGSRGADVAARADGLWPRYPPAREALDRLDAAIRSGDDGAVAHLLGPAAVLLPDGSTTSIGALIDTLQVEVSGVIARAREVAESARRSFGHVDALTAALTNLDSRAGALGAQRLPELRQARRELDALVDRLAADPLATPDTTAAERAVEAATAAVDVLDARRTSLPDRLARARAQLDELARLVPEGARALTEARAKIQQAGGLLEPVAPSVLEGGERSLGPWLDAIAAEAAAGAWLTADTGLARWQQVADGWTANARKILAANRRLLDRRAELRGLLESYQAKAADSGRAEDVALAELHRQAQDVLWSAPCDLDTAETAVRRYIAAVNAPPGVASPREDRA